MRTKLRRLREHKAWGSVKDILEQESYAQKLALERAKKFRNLDIYLKKSSRALDEYINQVDLVFWTNPLMYASEEAKCLYAAAFLGGIP